MNKYDKKIVIAIPTYNRPKEIVMVYYQNKWLPEEMVDNWHKEIDEAKKEINQKVTLIKPEEKPKLLAMMAALESILDQLAQAESQTEFNNILDVGMRENLR